MSVAYPLTYQADGFVESSPTVVDGVAYVGDGAGTVHAVNTIDFSLVWSEPVAGDAIRTDPQVVDGTVYVGSNDGYVYALDAGDATQEWQFQTGADVRSSPTCAEGTVYVGSDDGFVYAIDADTGNKEWEFDAGGSGYRVRTAPTVVGDLVYVGTQDDSYYGPESTVYAIDTENGDEAWSQGVNHWVNSDPTVVSATVYVGSDDGTLYALDSRTGNVEWEFTEPDAHVISATTHHDDVVYVATDDRISGTDDPTDAVMYALDANVGDKLWEFAVPVPADPSSEDWQFHASPTVVEDTGYSGGDTVFIGNVDGTVYGVGADTGDEVWSRDTGDAVWSSPTVVDGKLYVESHDDNLWAFDVAASGSSADSRVELGTLGHHEAWDGVPPTPPGSEVWVVEGPSSLDSAPTVVDGTVFVMDGDGTLRTYDAADGTEHWQFSTGDSALSAPAVTGDTVYVSSTDGNLYAVDAATGDENWTFVTGESIESSPTVGCGRVFVGSDDGNLYAVNTSDGTEDWRFVTGDRVQSSPTVDEGVVYVGSDDTNLYAVDAVGGSKVWSFATGDGVYSSPTVDEDSVYVGSLDDHVYAVDRTDGTKVWEYGTGGPVRSSPTFADGTVYVGSTDEHVHAIDASTGNRKWQFRTNAYSVPASPTVVAETVFVPGYTGTLYALDAAEGYEQWSYPMDHSSRSSPTVVDGTIYVGDIGSYSSGFLYALDAAVDGPSEDTRVELGTLGHHHVQANRPSELTVNVDDRQIPVGGEATISISAQCVEAVTIRGIWVDWDLADEDLDGGTETNLIDSDGTYEISWSGRQHGVSPSLTVGLDGDRYVGGTYGLDVTATNGTDTETDRMTIDLQ